MNYDSLVGTALSTVHEEDSKLLQRQSSMKYENSSEIIVHEILETDFLPPIKDDTKLVNDKKQAKKSIVKSTTVPVILLKGKTSVMKSDDSLSGMMTPLSSNISQHSSSRAELLPPSQALKLFDVIFLFFINIIL